MTEKRATKKEEIPPGGYMLGVSAERGGAFALCESEEEERELLGRLEETAGEATPCGQVVSFAYSKSSAKKLKNGTLSGKCFAALGWEGAGEGWAAEGWIWMEGERLPDRGMSAARRILEERAALDEASPKAEPGRKKPGL